MTLRLSLKNTRIAICILIGVVIGVIAVSYSNDYTTVYFLDSIWALCVAVGVGIDINNMRASANIRIIVALGLLARILVVILGIMGPISYRNLFNESDQGSFLRIAADYFCGDFTASNTRYPYIINGLYHVFGPFEWVVRALNIFAWYMGFQIIYIVSRKNLHGRTMELASAFYCLLPMQIKVTAGVMRESIMACSIMLSVFWLYKWMLNARVVYILLSVITTLPAVLLHTGCAAMLGAIFLTYVFWNNRTNNWKVLSWKAGLVLIALACAVPIYHLFCAVFANFNYLPKELTIESITSYPYWPGRSDYVIGNGVAHNLVEFVQGTLYRCFYFWVSPTPKFWNSPIDLIGFFGDSVPWIVFFFVFFKRMRIGSGKKFEIIGLFLVVLYTLVYAWGTRNAGTAIRHRDVLSGPLVLILMMENGYEHGIVGKIEK